MMLHMDPTRPSDLESRLAQWQQLDCIQRLDPDSRLAIQTAIDEVHRTTARLPMGIKEILLESATPSMIAQSKRTLQSEQQAESLPVRIGMFSQEVLDYLQSQRWEYDRATAALRPQRNPCASSP